VLVTHEPRYASYADRVLTVRDGVVSENAGRIVTLARDEDDEIMEGVS
jgi:putative ABC transport system ATP-binding protein